MWNSCTVESATLIGDKQKACFASFTAETLPVSVCADEGWMQNAFCAMRVLPFSLWVQRPHGRIPCRTHSFPSSLKHSGHTGHKPTAVKSNGLFQSFQPAVRMGHSDWGRSVFAVIRGAGYMQLFSM